MKNHPLYHAWLALDTGKLFEPNRSAYKAKVLAAIEYDPFLSGCEPIEGEALEVKAFELFVAEEEGRGVE